jgi:hypothetical protein
MAISGIIVAIETFDGADAGTDDEVYLGMWGKAGGREFPLSSSSADYFKRGVIGEYLLGLDLHVPGTHTVYSDQSRPGQDNDPAGIPIELASIDYVYLRKQAYGTGGDDDGWQLMKSGVVIYDAATYPWQPNQYRIFGFEAKNGLWLANEHGHQVWLKEGLNVFDS